MFIETGQTQRPTCPKCERAKLEGSKCEGSKCEGAECEGPNREGARREHGLRLHARLPQADGFPEVQCLECMDCGEVIIIEQFYSVHPSQAA